MISEEDSCGEYHSRAIRLLHAAKDALDLLDVLSPFEGDSIRHLRKAIEDFEQTKETGNDRYTESKNPS